MRWLTRTAGLRPRFDRLRCTLAAVVLVAATTNAGAHIVFGGTSLARLTAGADAIVRVRIEEPAALLNATHRGKAFRSTYVRGVVLETLEGEIEGPQLRFHQQGHGVVEYAAGEEVLVFLRRTAAIPELAQGPIAKHLAWASEQEGNARFAIDASNRKRVLDAVRGYLAISKEPLALRPDLQRRMTVELLGSEEPMLARSALHDLVFAGDAMQLTADDLPVLRPILEAKTAPLGVRIGLVAELARRGLVEAPAYLMKFLAQSAGRERIAVVRAMAAHPSPEIARALIALTGDGDEQLSTAAAVALGGQRAEGVVPALKALLSSESQALRMASIRALGRVAAPPARAVLEAAAEEHPDPPTRRRARAELRVLEGRGGASKPQHPHSH